MAKTPCKHFKDISTPADESIDMLTDDGAFHCELGHKLKDEFDFAFTCCCNDGGTALCADFSAVSVNPEMQKIFDEVEGYFDQAVNGNTNAYRDAMKWFDVLVQNFNESGNEDICIEIIKLKNKGGMESFRMGIDALFNKIDFNNITLRSCLTGKSVDTLKAEDQEATEKKRLQSEEWAARGLCRNCGGQLGLFKKCKSCGAKN